LPRRHLPAKELTALSDYRERYAQYREDADLQELHRLHPFIVVWDDHEVANNTWREGAQNHQPEKEGAFKERRKAALKAYFEWLPIRRFDDAIYRSFDFGELATLWMLDGRQYRDVQPALGDSLRYEPNRSLLGANQFDWLVNGLNKSKAVWNVLGNDVMMSTVDYGKLLPEGTDFFLDMWDGYPAERNRLMEAMKATGRQNFIVLTGDIHSSWGFELTPDGKGESYKQSNGKQSLGAEWVTPSITSKNFGEYINNEARTKLFEQLLKGSNPHLKYVDLLAHGYLVVTLTATVAKADWFNIISIKNPGQPAIQHVHSTKLNKGSGQLQNLQVSTAN
jgi:alkaline phosphatase D